MDTVECPYCKQECELCHDDGAFCNEDNYEENICEHCDKTFLVSTHISYYYESLCVNHNYKKSEKFTDPCKHDSDKYYYECERCEHTAYLTDKEFEELHNETST